MKTVCGTILAAVGLTFSAHSAFDVRDFGATGDGTTMDTASIQSAIDKCGESGGGRVVLANGTFLSGSIRLRTGVELHIDGTARLLASPDIADFPEWKDVKHVKSENLPRGRNACFIFADEAERISITGDGVIAPVMPEIISSCYAEPCLITRHRLTYKFGIRASACVRTERLCERVERTVIDFHAGNIIAVIEAYVTVVLRVAQRSVRDRHRDGDPLLRTGLACNAGLVVAVVGRVILHPQFACTAVEVGHFENEGIHRGRHRLLVNAEIEELGGRDIYALAAGFCLDDRVGFVVRVSVTASGHVQRRRRGIIRQRRSWNSGVHAA